MLKKYAKELIDSVKYHPHPHMHLPATSISLQKQLSIMRGESQPEHELYRKLMKNCIPLRSSYRQSKQQKRKEISQMQYSLWRQYVLDCKESLDSKFRITEKHKKQVEQAMQVTKFRLDKGLHAQRVPFFFNQYAKGFGIDFQIYPRHLASICHPHFGYLARTGKTYSLNDLLQLLQGLAVAFNMTQLGYIQHSFEIQAFSFWRLLINKPDATLDQFSRMLAAFKIKCEGNVESLQKQFKYLLREKQGEVESSGVRFDLWRQISLQRNI